MNTLIDNAIDDQIEKYTEEYKKEKKRENFLEAELNYSIVQSLKRYKQKIIEKNKNNSWLLRVTMYNVHIQLINSEEKSWIHLSNPQDHVKLALK